jgi:formamidopyrimidine-DNA glycosylase
MPELPEVETIRRDLSACLIGRRIMEINILNTKTALPSAAFLKSHLSSRRIKAIDRRGKLLIIRLVAKKDEPSNLLIHLKMTGQLIYEDKAYVVSGGHSLSSRGNSGFLGAVGGELPNKHTRVILSFNGGRRLFFNDLRKFGYMRLTSDEELDNLIAKNYGPEPLTPAFTVAALLGAIKNKKSNIKAVLLNQKLIAGLGNIYVDEALYAAKINPVRAALSLTMEEIKLLYRQIERLIKAAILQRGTTFSDYMDLNGRQGNFSRFLQVYGRSGLDCRRCGQKIKKMKLAGRGTHYCQNCQC